jgi:hypothetical protein
MNKFKFLEDDADKILAMDNRIITIEKNPQIGFTTSIIKRSLELDKDIVVLEPTIKILDQTVEEAMKLIHPRKRHVLLRDNKSICGSRARKDLYYPFYHLGDCRGCNIKRCPYNLIEQYHIDLIGMTYQKFRVLDGSKRAKNTYNIIKKYDVLLLDEFTRMLMMQPPSVEVEWLRKIKIPIGMVSNPFVERINEIVDFVDNTDTRDWDQIDGIARYSNEAMGMYDYFDDLKELKIPKKQLADILLMLTTDEIIFCIEHHHGEDHQVLIPDISTPFKKLAKFCKEDYNGKVIITGMNVPDITPFQGKRIYLEDYNRTQDQKLIVCDRANWDFERNWRREKDKIFNIIDKIIGKFVDIEEDIKVFAINKRICEDVKERYKGKIDAQLYPSLFTYYRSDQSSGVSFDERIMICIGLPHTPLDAMYAYAQVSEIPKRADELREIEIKEVSKNVIMGRCLDPEGEERSIAFVLGARKEEVQKYLPDKKDRIIETTHGSITPDVAVYMIWSWIGGIRLEATYDELKTNPIEDWNDIPKLAAVNAYMRESKKRDKFSMNRIGRTFDGSFEDAVDLYQKYPKRAPFVYFMLKEYERGYSLIWKGEPKYL